MLFQIHVLHSQSLFKEDEIRDKIKTKRCPGPNVDIFMMMDLKKETDALKRDVERLTNEVESLKDELKDANLTEVENAKKFISKEGCIIFANFCFKFSNYKASWIDAQSECKKNGGYLAEPDSTEINNKLVEIYEQADKDKYRYFWLGGSDVDEKSKWMWMNREKRSFTYTNWGPGQPTNTTYMNCLLFDGVSSWKNDICDFPFYFMCQKQLSI